MTLQGLLPILTVLNVALLLWSLAGPNAVVAETAAGMLRGTGLEIVDDQGRVRASIAVLPASQAADGSPTEETVLLRLINADGQPSVKIGVGPATAGMSLVGGDDQSYILVKANGPSSSVKLVGPQGARTIEP